MTLFDIIILVGPYDEEVIKKQILYTQANILDYRNVYLVCSRPDITVEGCIAIDERTFPFTIDSVADIHGKGDRNGWYLQQLIKLYAGQCIPGILETYLVIDCDTFFIQPTHFIQDGKCLYNYGREYHRPYFEHMKQVCPLFRKMHLDKSGICHHMMFQTKYVNEMMLTVETMEQSGDPFWKIFLEKVDIQERGESGASEYEMYFNYMLAYHPTEIILRPLSWNNDITNIEHLDIDKLRESFVYFSCHHYKRM